MKNTLQLILILACCTVFGQQQAVSAGGEATGSGGSSSYSIGQIAQNYSIGSNGSLSEGLQQPFEFSTLGTDNFPNIVLEMSTYPNPATRNVTLKIANLYSENLSYQIVDITCKQISEVKILNVETQISLENLNASIYFLIVNNQTKTIKTFKIIKN